MSHPKFTPGPWTAVPVAAPMVRSKGGVTWAILATEPMRGRIDSQIEGISEPNARLMAAAPTMYAALQIAKVFAETERECRVRSYADDSEPYVMESRNTLNAINAAIAKAEEEATQ